MKTIQFVILFLLISINAIAQNLKSNHLLIINTYNQKGSPEKALNYYKKNITDVNKNIDLQLGIGTTYYQLKDYKEATNIFINVNKKNIKKANYQLAQCYGRLHKSELAVAYLRIHLTSTSKGRRMQRTIKSDKAFATITLSTEWNELWREKEWYSKYDLMFEDAQYEYDLNNYEKALSILNQINNIRKSMINAYYLKSLTYLKLNEPENALVSINTAIKRRNKIADYYATKAIIENEINKPKKALKSIATAIQIDSTQISYYFTRANSYLMDGKLDDAENDLEAMVSLVPDFEVYKLAGEIYYIGGEYQNALKAYNKCIALQKHNTDIYISRGDIYQKIYAYEFAEKDYSMALDFQPFNGELYYKRGLTRKQQHKTASACSDFHKAFKYKYMKADEEIRGYCQKR